MACGRPPTKMAPEDGAVDRAQPAHDHHQQQLDRQQNVEGVGRDVAQLVAEQRAGQAGDAGAQREGDGLVAHQIDAEALRRDLEVADRHHGAARRRARQVDGAKHHQDEHREAQVVELRAACRAMAEDVGRRHGHALEAAGHRLPAHHHLLDDLRKRQGGDGEIDAGHAVGGQRHGDAGRQRREPGRREAR